MWIAPLVSCVWSDWMVVFVMPMSTGTGSCCPCTKICRSKWMCCVVPSAGRWSALARAADRAALASHGAWLVSMPGSALEGVVSLGLVMKRTAPAIATEATDSERS